MMVRLFRLKSAKETVEEEDRKNEERSHRFLTAVVRVLFFT